MLVCVCVCVKICSSTCYFLLVSVCRVVGAYALDLYVFVNTLVCILECECVSGVGWG
jgi:hypothetical protein